MSGGVQLLGYRLLKRCCPTALLLCLVSYHLGVFVWVSSWGLWAVALIGVSAPPWEDVLTSLCLLAYSTKQEFLFLTAAPDAGRSLRETHFPEELKVGTARPRH